MEEYRRDLQTTPPVDIVKRHGDTFERMHRELKPLIVEFFKQHGHFPDVRHEAAHRSPEGRISYLLTVLDELKRVHEAAGGSAQIIKYLDFASELDAAMALHGFTKEQRDDFALFPLLEEFVEFFGRVKDITEREAGALVDKGDTYLDTAKMILSTLEWTAGIDTLREALRLLENAGIITMEPGELPAITVEAMNITAAALAEYFARERLTVEDRPWSRVTKSFEYLDASGTRRQLTRKNVKAVKDQHGENLENHPTYERIAEALTTLA